MDKFDTLPYSKLPKYCNHCGGKTPMKVVVEKAISEDLHFYTLEYGDVVDHQSREWQILICPLCKGRNVIETFTTAEQGEIIGTGINGEPIYDNSTETVLFPITDLTIPEPNPNIPSEIEKDFIEAKKIFPFSARSSAALLRLVIQKLCIYLGEKGKDINTDIQELVNKGLPQHIQQALDIVRVIGNEAVHPGEINVRDNPEIAKKLFSLVNEIIDDRISKTHKQAEIEKIYQTLPENKLEGIRQRNKPKDYETE